LRKKKPPYNVTPKKVRSLDGTCRQETERGLLIGGTVDLGILKMLLRKEKKQRQNLDNKALHQGSLGQPRLSWGKKRNYGILDACSH